ncbi:MAG: hypothetical protein PVH08_09395, partial [Syntrophobacterales bacterium]
IRETETRRRGVTLTLTQRIMVGEDNRGFTDQEYEQRSRPFFLPRRRVSVSLTLSNRFEPIRNPTGV